MSGETEVQAPPWAGLTWEGYCAEVRALSAYRPDRLCRASARGMLTELGELLGLFDDRRVAKKGPPSREAVRAELGDVLWYAALDWRDEIGGDVDNWPCRAVEPMLRTEMDGVDEYAGCITTVIGNVCDGMDRAFVAIFLCFEAGFSAQEVAWFNIEKLRARREAGTLHDREARVPGGGV